MSNRIMRVFYGNDYLPYKDKELTKHFPIVGNEFVGANNITEIRFYCDNMNASATYVANIKLPNGRLTSRLCVSGADNDGNYKSLVLDYKITELKGNVYIGLNGYSGLVDITDENEDGILEINGTPDIIATGVINIAMNYAPIVVPYDNLEFSDYQTLLGYIGNKANKELTIGVIDSLSSQYSEYANGQIIYVKSERKLYSKHDSQLTEITLKDIETINSTLTSALSRLSNVEANKADKEKTVGIVEVVGDEPIENLFEDFRSSIIAGETKPFVAHYNGKYYYCAIKQSGSDPLIVYSFEFENAYENITHIGSYVSGSKTFAEIISSSQYAQTYITSSALLPYALKTDLTTKADLVNGKVPSSQLPSYVDDIVIIENSGSFDIHNTLIAPYLTRGFATLSEAQSLCMYVGIDYSGHTTFESIGYVFGHELLTTPVERTYNYLYKFTKHEDNLYYFDRVSNADEVLSSANILLCHETNKQYRRIQDANFRFSDVVYGSTYYTLLSTNLFAEIKSTLALGETSSTAFAGNRGKALETRMTSVESSVANIPNEIEEQFNDRIGATHIVNLTQSEYQALETKDSDTFYFVVED